MTKPKTATNIRLAIALAIVCSFIPLGLWASYEEGEALNRQGNREAAFAAFQAAARQGDERAFGKLGGMCLYGVGTARDFICAYAWFTLAEEQGDRLAERFRLTASAAMTPAQIEQARQLAEDKRRELSIE